MGGGGEKGASAPRLTGSQAVRSAIKHQRHNGHLWGYIFTLLGMCNTAALLTRPSACSAYSGPCHNQTHGAYAAAKTNGAKNKTT